MDWSLLAAPALVDWCEPNYAATPLVAEWWNTLTSSVLVTMGLGCAWRMRGAELRFRLGMYGLAAVGAGSAAFHGTLLRLAQAADELPMVWLGLACVWALADRARPTGEGIPLARALAAFGAVFCLVYATVPWAFVLFLGCYASMVAWVAVRTVQLTWWRGSLAPPALRRAAATMIVAYLGGFFLFWVPEHLILACDHPLQGAHLHALWHLGAGVGTAAWWEWAWLDRQHVRAEVAAGPAAVALS